MDIFFPIQLFADFVTFRLFSLQSGSSVANSTNFFIYDSIKIIFLLIAINYFMAIFRYYLPIDKIKKVLTARNWYGADYFLAAIFGVITPFCSCSSIPLFIGFLSAGIPLGVTFSFLIASPLVNEASLVLFPALFGWQISILYNIVGIVVAILGGLLIAKLKMEKYIEPAFLKLKINENLSTRENASILHLNKLWIMEGMQITKELIPYVLFGIGVGAIIHGSIPANYFEGYLSGNNVWSVPLATLIGVPLYANSVSVIPIMDALVNKGVALGTALSFMTSTVTLSIPQALILKKVMKIPLLLTFFGVTIVGIIFMGYLFNALY